MTAVQAVLDFWFGDLHTPEGSYAAQRKLWFTKNPETDEKIRQEFHALYAQAALGELDSWEAEPESCLALLVLLDQFPRNLFRDEAQAFATDEQALQIAQRAIANGFDQALPPLPRLFFYLPLEHSENLADQQQSVTLFEALIQEAPELSDPYDYALRHRDVIAQFGRFPHRNAILGRSSTLAEVEFLKQPGSHF